MVEVLNNLWFFIVSFFFPFSSLFHFWWKRCIKHSGQCCITFLLKFCPKYFAGHCIFNFLSSLVFDMFHKNCINPSSSAGYCTICEKDLYICVCCFTRFIFLFQSFHQIVFTVMMFIVLLLLVLNCFIGWNCVLQASFSTRTGLFKARLC